MELDEEYTGWQWWLACSNGGKEADDMGILEVSNKERLFKATSKKRTLKRQKTMFYPA